MTEEKQIEELAKDVFESGMLEGDSRSRIVAEELFYKGYRKQSEVVKEFADKAKQWASLLYGDGEFASKVCEIIDRVSKEMGVE